MILKIVQAKRWHHQSTGRTASIFGAVPWITEGDRPNWIVEVTGWTWCNSDGTYGLSRPSAATYEEAVEVMERVNSRRYGSRWRRWRR